jgi:hypothetical protein
MNNDEPKTVTWYGVKMGSRVYGAFDTFDDEAGRDAHLNGEIAKAFMSNASILQRTLRLKGWRCSRAREATLGWPPIELPQRPGAYSPQAAFATVQRCIHAPRAQQ